MTDASEHSVLFAKLRSFPGELRATTSCPKSLPAPPDR
jgi:hypothetical protein